MKTAAAVVAALAWTVLIGGAGVYVGYALRGAAEVTKEVQAQDVERKTKVRKDRNALGAGVRTEQAQMAADQSFQQIRANYETDQRNNPGIGCVLDPDSLRRWNEANEQSAGGTPGEPAGEVPTTAEGQTGGERGG